MSQILRQQGVTCSAPVEGFIQELLEEDTFWDNVVCTLLQDISAFCGRRLNMNVLVNYFDNRISIVRYMLTEKQFQKLMIIFARRKEAFYEAKEAV